MLAAPSLRKRPVKVPNLKPLRLFLPPWYEHVKGFLSKCTVLKLDLLWDHQIHRLEACMCALFSPEILQAWAVKGLTVAALSMQCREGGCREGGGRSFIARRGLTVAALSMQCRGRGCGGGGCRKGGGRSSIPRRGLTVAALSMQCREGGCRKGGGEVIHCT